MAIRMDKYHRLVSAGFIPQLRLPQGEFYQKTWYRNAIYVDITYSNREEGNIQTILAPKIDWNYQTFERVDNPELTMVLYPPEYIYQMSWDFYRRQNAQLLNHFAGLITHREWCLKTVHLVVKSSNGTDTGAWGEDAWAEVVLGDQTYRFPAHGQSVVNVANQLKTLLNNDPSIQTSVMGNQVNINLGARERDFYVLLKVTNPTADEKFILNPAVGTEDDPGKTYGWASKSYLTTTNKELKYVALVGVDRELEPGDPIPSLEDENMPDLVVVMTDLQQEPFVFYTVKMRPLLTAANLNHQIYTTSRVYGRVSAERSEFGLLPDPKPNEIIIYEDQRYPVMLTNQNLALDGDLNAWVYEYSPSIDILYGVYGFIFKYQILNYNMDEGKVNGDLINFRVYLNGTSLAIEQNSTVSTKYNTQLKQAQFHNLKLEGGTSSTDSSMMIPKPPDDGGLPNTSSTDNYRTYAGFITNKDYGDYLDSYWNINEVEQTVNIQLNSEDETDIRTITFWNFTYTLKYNGQTIHTSSAFYPPLVCQPFIGYQSDDVISNDIYELEFEIHQHTGTFDPLPYRVGDYPLNNSSLAAVFDTNITDSLCYVHYAFWFKQSYIIRSNAIYYLTQARAVARPLGQDFLDDTTVMNTNEMNRVVGDLTAYQADISKGIYWYSTPQHQDSHDAKQTAKQHADNLSTSIEPLVTQHNEICKALAEYPEREAERQNVLDQIEQAFNDYVALHYTVLVNNFASTQLIEELEPGEFFIAPAYG